MSLVWKKHNNKRTTALIFIWHIYKFALLFNGIIEISY